MKDTVRDELKEKEYPYPDDEMGYWGKGKEQFSRKEVAYLLYSQRAAISNDIAMCGNQIPSAIWDVLKNPRQPKF